MHRPATQENKRSLVLQRKRSQQSGSAAWAEPLFSLGLDNMIYPGYPLYFCVYIWLFLVVFGCFFTLFLVVFGCFEVYFLESHRSVFFRIPWRAAERPPRICDDFLRFRRESRPASWVDFFKIIFLKLTIFLNFWNSEKKVAQLAGSIFSKLFLGFFFFFEFADFPPSYSWVHFGAETATVTILKCAAAASRPPLPHPFL